MARTTRVRSDPNGLWVRADGRVFRPGSVSCVIGDMSDGNLNTGDQVRARHVSGTTRARITLSDGRELLWHNDYAHALEADMKNEAVAMRASGINMDGVIQDIIRYATVGEIDKGDVEIPSDRFTPTQG